MPSRIIKETIIISESLTAISAEAERFFWRLVVKADDFGLYYGDPRILASLCFPQKPPSEQKIRSWLNELVREDMVGTYSALGRREEVPETSELGQMPTDQGEVQQIP